MSDMHNASTPKIPVSTGVPPVATALFILGFIIIVAILAIVGATATIARMAIVGATASYGRVWPSSDSAKIPLTAKPSLK